MILRIDMAGADDLADWTRLRGKLWPGVDAVDHYSDLVQLLAKPDNAVGFLARDAEGLALGFTEAALRTDYVNGCDTSPVAFLEGLYVVEASRRMGVGRGLIEAVEAWARGNGCCELASDALLENTAAHAAHVSLDFEETERVVYFRKLLENAPTLS